LSIFTNATIITIACGAQHLFRLRVVVGFFFSGAYFSSIYCSMSYNFVSLFTNERLKMLSPYSYIQLLTRGLFLNSMF